MARNTKADGIRGAFLGALKAQGAAVETMIDLAAHESNPTIRRVFLGLGQAGREVYLVRGVGLINVHVRSEPPGWWSILKTVKSDLDYLRNEIGVICHYVLLVGRNDQHIANGYIATDFSAPPFRSPPGVEATKYTVNERQHLDSKKLLLSVGKIAKVLMQSAQMT
jgi:hypothetical protein